MKDLMTWTHLCHPNILPLYGLYCHSGQNFLVFPWITGGNLRNYLQQSPDASRMHLVGSDTDSVFTMDTDPSRLLRSWLGYIIYMNRVSFMPISRQYAILTHDYPNVYDSHLPS